MNRPRCSVVLPTYNRARSLRRAIASVLAQDEPDFELIVVDDASSDGTPALVEGLDDPRIRYHRCERNVGPSGARNLGIELAQADVIAFLDSDDAYRPSRLSRPLAVFEREADVVCTLSSAAKQAEDGQERTALLPDVKLASRPFEWAMLADLVGVEGSSITVRTAQAREAGGFNAALRRTEDREFLVRLARLGALRILPEVLFDKGWSTDGLSNERKGAGRDLIAYFRARPEYLGAHRDLGHYLATKILVMHVRHGDLTTLAADIGRFRAAGLLQAGVARLWRDHVAVKRYRRAHSSAPALAALTGPPEPSR